MVSVCFHIEKLRVFSRGLSDINIVFKNSTHGDFQVEVRLDCKVRSIWMSSDGWVVRHADRGA